MILCGHHLRSTPNFCLRFLPPISLSPPRIGPSLSPPFVQLRIEQKKKPLSLSLFSPADDLLRPVFLRRSTNREENLQNGSGGGHPPLLGLIKLIIRIIVGFVFLGVVIYSSDAGKHISAQLKLMGLGETRMRQIHALAFVVLAAVLGHYFMDFMDFMEKSKADLGPQQEQAAAYKAILKFVKESEARNEAILKLAKTLEDHPEYLKLLLKTEDVEGKGKDN